MLVAPALCGGKLWVLILSPDLIYIYIYYYYYYYYSLVILGSCTKLLVKVISTFIWSQIKYIHFFFIYIAVLCPIGIVSLYLIYIYIYRLIEE